MDQKMNTPGTSGVELSPLICSSTRFCFGRCFVPVRGQSLNEQYSKVTQAVKFVLLYQQSVKHGDFSPVNMLEEAYKKAMDAYTHPKVMSDTSFVQ